jgi:hypothetical protein
MKRYIRQVISAVAALAVAVVVAVGFAGTGSAAPAANSTLCKVPASPPALTAYGISNDGTLMASFKTNKPQQLDWVSNPTGLITDTTLIGLDCRVQDGKLYVVGNYGGIYTVTLTDSLDAVLTKVSQLTIGLNGATFGVDFNPAADRLRVISDTGQNLRHDLNTHTTLADTPLSVQPGPLPLNPPSTPATGATAAAYTNNDLDPGTATTLFDINTLTGQVAIQSPANTGLLAPTGALGTSVAASAGFDIYSTLNSGKTVSNSGFAALIPSSTGKATFFTVDMLSGTATSVGQFPLQITGIAIQLGS